MEGLKGKLENRYRGRFWIVDRTKMGNYIIKNAKGEILKEQFALNKLKPINIDDSELSKESYEIEEIIDSRNNKGKLQFLVKWKNYSDEENEWIGEEMFDTVEIIDEYFKRIHRKDQEGKEHTAPVEKEKRGRPKKANMVKYFLSLIFLVIFQSILTVNASMIQLEGEFRLCGESNKIIDRKNTCLKRNSNINQIAPELVLNLNKTIRTTLLEKLHNQVSGEGYQCKI